MLRPSKQLRHISNHFLGIQEQAAANNFIPVCTLVCARSWADEAAHPMLRHWIEPLLRHVFGSSIALLLPGAGS